MEQTIFQQVPMIIRKYELFSSLEGIFIHHLKGVRREEEKERK